MHSNTYICNGDRKCDTRMSQSRREFDVVLTGPKREIMSFCLTLVCLNHICLTFLHKVRNCYLLGVTFNGKASVWSILWKSCTLDQKSLFIQNAYQEQLTSSGPVPTADFCLRVASICRVPVVEDSAIEIYSYTILRLIKHRWTSLTIFLYFGALRFRTAGTHSDQTLWKSTIPPLWFRNSQKNFRAKTQK